MRLAHEVDFRSLSHTALRVLLIGSGGNGSAVLFGLPYLHQAMIAWGMSGLSVTVLDHDTVSPTNCVRQPFGQAEIGQHKAISLVNRVNLFHGLTWSAIPRRFSPELEINESMLYHGWDLVISCVDTKKARADMHSAFFGASGEWSQVKYWLDLGNNASNGQFVLGQPYNRRNRGVKRRLPCVTELFPAIMDINAGEDNLPSCSAAEALERQEPFINNVLASSALAMLTRLMRYGRIDYHGSFYNAATGGIAPLAIDPEAWAKQRRRDRESARKAA
jgi:PRTRC genetic system ThiF family protein